MFHCLAGLKSRDSTVFFKDDIIGKWITQTAHKLSRQWLRLSTSGVALEDKRSPAPPLSYCSLLSPKHGSLRVW